MKEIEVVHDYFAKYSKMDRDFTVYIGRVPYVKNHVNFYLDVYNCHRWLGIHALLCKQVVRGMLHQRFFDVLDGLDSYTRVVVLCDEENSNTCIRDMVAEVIRGYLRGPSEYGKLILDLLRDDGNLDEHVDLVVIPPLQYGGVIRLYKVEVEKDFLYLMTFRKEVYCLYGDPEKMYAQLLLSF